MMTTAGVTATVTVTVTIATTTAMTATAMTIGNTAVTATTAEASFQP